MGHCVARNILFRHSSVDAHLAVSTFGLYEHGGTSISLSLLSIRLGRYLEMELLDHMGTCF